MVGNHTEPQALRGKAEEALVISRSSLASIFDLNRCQFMIGVGRKGLGGDDSRMVSVIPWIVLDW